MHEGVVVPRGMLKMLCGVHPGPPPHRHVPLTHLAGATDARLTSRGARAVAIDAASCRRTGISRWWLWCRVDADDSVVGSEGSRVQASIGDYGDPRALPILEGAIEDFVIDRGSPYGLMGLPDLVDAYERIDGPLPEGLRKQVDAVHAEWHSLRTKTVTVKQKVARNDPCPCGSGRTYECCCIGKSVP